MVNVHLECAERVLNDLPSCSNIIKFHVFADDTSIFYSHKNAKDLQTIVNCKLNKVSTWLSANRLSLNVDKSNFLIISKKKKQILPLIFKLITILLKRKIV